MTKEMRREFNLPLCPEICKLCRDRVVPNRHVMHVMNELGDLTVSLTKDGRHFLIQGCVEAGDLFWIEMLLKEASNVVTKAESIVE